MCVKKYVLVVLVFLFISASAYAQTIQVVTEELAPYNYTEEGKVVGFCTEIVQEVLTRAGLAYTIVSHPWEEAYKIAQTQPNVLIYSIGRNVQREPLFNWVGVITRMEVYFFKLRSRPDIRIETLDDARHYKIGAVKDDFRAQFLIKEGFETQLEYVPDDRQNIWNLLDRKIDLAPLDEMSAYYITNQEGHAFLENLEKTLYIKDVSVDLYIAFSKRTAAEIVKKCQAALEILKQDGTYEKIKSNYEIFYLPFFGSSGY